MINAPVVVSAHTKPCSYALLIWIKVMLVKERSAVPGVFAVIILTEYQKIYCTKE